MITLGHKWPGAHQYRCTLYTVWCTLCTLNGVHCTSVHTMDSIVSQLPYRHLSVHSAGHLLQSGRIPGDLHHLHKKSLQEPTFGDKKSGLTSSSIVQFAIFLTCRSTSGLFSICRISGFRSITWVVRFGQVCTGGRCAQVAGCRKVVSRVSGHLLHLRVGLEHLPDDVRVAHETLGQGVVQHLAAARGSNGTILNKNMGKNPRLQVKYKCAFQGPG